MSGLSLAGTEGRGSKPTCVGLDGPKARCLWHRAVPQRRRPCRARLRLQAQTVPQAGSMLPEFPAPPLPAHRIAARSGASNCRI